MRAALPVVAWAAIAIAAAPAAIVIMDGMAAGAPASSAGVAGVAGAASPTAAAAIASAPGGHNLLANGGFSRGSGNSPDDWRTGGWKEAPTVTSYDWLHSAGSEPELIVNNLQPNDARWLQTLTLEPGWYYIGAEARTEQVPPDATGASVSLDEDGINSPDLRGSADWQSLGFYLKVGPHGADVDVALRLGGFSSLNTGRAFFRNASVVKVGALPVGASPAFDLSAVRRNLAAPPLGKPWTLAAALALLLFLVIAGWNVYGAKEPAPAPAPPHLPPAGRRRRKDGARPRR